MTCVCSARNQKQSLNNVDRHYWTKHCEYESVQGQLRNNKSENLKMRLREQQIFVRKGCKPKILCREVLCVVNQNIVKPTKLYPYGEFFLKNVWSPLVFFSYSDMRFWK
jgi:hypothetical protein